VKHPDDEGRRVASTPRRRASADPHVHGRRRMTSDHRADPLDDPRLEHYAARVEASPHNLLSRRGLAELRTRHIPECAAFARLLPSGPATVLDLGAGGGLPGLVVAILRPDLDVHLLDSTRKKTAFLTETAAHLDVPVTVHTGRAEDLDRGRRYDVVTARAVAPLERLVRWAAPLLVPGGLLYAIKGDRWRAEIDDAAATLGRVSMQVVSTPDEQNLHEPYAPRVIILRRG
jgi:16S rRNA (guanine527-N7)-methyltransferase